MRFVWDDRLKTGNFEVDDQHKQIVALIGRMSAQEKKQSDPMELQKLFDALHLYAHTHFATEQALVYQANLTETSLWFNHQGAHDYYMKRIQEFREDLERKDERALFRIVAFLKYWWVEHICNEDQLLVEVLNDKATHEAAKTEPERSVRVQS